MIRAATADLDLTVTIALTGLGTAQVDDLAIRTLSFSGAITQSQTSQQPTANQRRPPLAVSR
jgi:hypothetical protein